MKQWDGAVVCDIVLYPESWQNYRSKIHFDNKLTLVRQASWEFKTAFNLENEQFLDEGNTETLPAANANIRNTCELTHVFQKVKRRSFR